MWQFSDIRDEYWFRLRRIGVAHSRNGHLGLLDVSRQERYQIF